MENRNEANKPRNQIFSAIFDSILFFCIGGFFLYGSIYAHFEVSLENILLNTKSHIFCFFTFYSSLLAQVGLVYFLQKNLEPKNSPNSKTENLSQDYKLQRNKHKATVLILAIFNFICFYLGYRLYSEYRDHFEDDTSSRKFISCGISSMTFLFLSYAITNELMRKIKDFSTASFIVVVCLYCFLNAFPIFDGLHLHDFYGMIFGLKAYAYLQEKCLGDIHRQEKILDQ